MAGKSRIPMETQQAIATEYSAGARTGDLALKYGFNRATILDIARRNGCKMRGQHYQSGRPKMKTEHLHAEVIRLRDLGWSQQKIGAEIGVSQAIVSRALRKLGRPTFTGAINHGNWKGGKTETSNGYIAVFGGDFPEMQDTQGYTLEHRLVMARHLGRALTNRETVHHINGDRQDNRIENLQLRQGKHGAGAVFRCRCCGSFDIESIKIAEVE
jgi:predicted DNA-binding protein (UPF0251 family)